MDIRELEYVVAIHESRSFTRAAQTLNIAQPSLSQQIKKLEQELGTVLFVRGRGPLSTTPDGLRFIQSARAIIQMRVDLEREMRERREGMGRELVIGTTAITGAHVLPPLLRAYEARYPTVQVRLVEEATERLGSLVADAAVDVAIMPLPVEHPLLATHPMVTEPLYLALPDAVRSWMTPAVQRWVRSGERNANALELKELAMSPFIVLKQGYGFRGTVLQLCAESGFQAHIVYETSSIETAQALVAQGLGVTLVPAMVVHRDRSPRPLYATLASHPTRTLVLAYHRDRYLGMAAQAFFALYDEIAADKR